MVLVAGANLDRMALFGGIDGVRGDRLLGEFVFGLRFNAEAADTRQIAATRPEREQERRSSRHAPARCCRGGPGSISDDELGEPVGRGLLQNAGKGVAQPRPIRLKASAPRSHFGIGVQPRIEIGALFLRQLAVERHMDVAFGEVAPAHRSTTLMARRRATSSSRPRNSSRPRATRDISVPAGMPSIVAASA